jgi:2-methylcitrate dehydratase PrpD
MIVDSRPFDLPADVSPAPLAEGLASFAIGFDLADLPSRLVERARLCLLDGLGAILAGSRTETGATARALVEEVGGPPQARVLGSDLRTAAPWAALANGLQAHALEVDDGHRTAIGLHSAAVVLSAALAVAERRGSTGAELLAALVVGYQVAGRIGAAINPGHRYLGFHTTGTVGPFGAAAAAARLLGLDVARTTRALGLAGSLAGGVFEFLSDGSTVKHLHGGAAAQHGVLAALLAERGLTGPTTVLEGPEGFLHAYARDVDIDVASIVAELDSRWELDSVFFKLHAACAHCFAPIDAALELRQALAGRSVRAGLVRTYRASALLDHQVVTTRQEAKFSIPYCVAAALVLGRATEDAFDGRHLADSALADLASRIAVEESAELTADFPRTRAADLRLELVDGTVLERRIDVPRGMPEYPAEPADLLGKFRALVGPILGSDRTDALVAAVGNIESLPVAALVALAG